MTMLTKISAVLFGVVAMGAVAGCAADETNLSEVSAEAARSIKLNLSHVECRDDGTVQAHFVLLFAGKQQPEPLTGTWNGGSFGPVAPYKNSGNVWHYEVFLPAGFIDILSASVGSASLHNPGEYAGNYVCDGSDEQEELCPIASVGAQCHPTLGNPGEECAMLGLTPIGKDDGLSGLDFTATMDAYVAIVKSGRGECAQGESSYNVIVDVSVGDVLATPFAQDISHVTYCECPTPAE
jgi:hypothetical protein